MMTVKIAPNIGLEHRILGRIERLRSDDCMEDLEREVPHGEDDDDGDQACEDENDDLLEPFVEREQHPLRARSPKSVLPLHRRSFHASQITSD